MKNPYVNAILAFVYIMGVATFIQNVPEAHFDSILPIFAITIVLSLLVLSVALMGFLFFYMPAKLYLEDRHTEAIQFFAKTLVTFGVLLLILVTAVLLVPINF